jgi:hypothetical protein
MKYLTAKNNWFSFLIFNINSRIYSKTGFTLSGEWGVRELALLEEVFTRYREAGMPVPFPFPVRIAMEHSGKNCLRGNKTICLNANGLTAWTISHELAHGWDAADGWRLSKAMRKATKSGFLWQFGHRWQPEWRLFWYRVGNPPTPCGVDKHFNAIEDFAEAVTAYLYPEEAAKRAAERGMPYEKWGYAHFHDTPRGIFLRELIGKMKV